MNFILGLVALIYLVAFPIISLRYLLKNRDKLETPAIRLKYGSLYQNVDPSRPVALRFTMYFCVRRLAFALLICILSDNLNGQVMIADFAILAMLIFYTANMPMKDLMNNLVQIGNEIAIILLLQFMFLLTDFTEDPVDRHRYGYYFLYYVAVLIGLNLVVLIISISLVIRLACRKCYYNKRNKRILKERQEAQLLKLKNKLNEGTVDGKDEEKKIETILE